MTGGQDHRHERLCFLRCSCLRCRKILKGLTENGAGRGGAGESVQGSDTVGAQPGSGGRPAEGLGPGAAREGQAVVLAPRGRGE